ncbi:response regulator transcription factor [Cohnella nanjingensis]|uniref:Response regulator n=1 Tax=Cohnella nanjingensis TaxID=1387779 RepID=A0A7X0RMF7_9BACL|nr:response regulator [Cohnella nanjingensis]MBB6670218.1 response regulator [Cohnella nanjingensis]
MYKVLIVEDEMLVRVGLKNSIPWSQHDMKVIADVSNGREALAVYESEKPDLIVTDLKMPVMDGLEMISEIRSKDVDTKILILSCMEEFEYARKAASLKVSGYILKLTMTVEEMEDVLASVAEELRSRSLAPATPVPFNHRLSLNMLKEKLLKDYLFYGVYSEGELRTLLKQMDSPIDDPGRVAMAIMETNEYSRLLKRFSDDRGELIRFTVLNILNEIMDNHGAGEAYHDRDHRYILLFSFDPRNGDEDNRAKLNVVFDNIRKVMLTYFDVPVFIGVSAFGDGFRHLKKRYQDCVALMEGRYFSEAYVQFAAEWSPLGGERRWKQLTLKSCSAWESLGAPYGEDLRRETEKRLAQPLPDEASWKRLFVGLMDWSRAYLGIPEDHAALMELSGSERIQASPAVLDSIHAWEVYLEETAKLKDMIKSVSKEVAEAVQYIQKRYDQDISLKEISEYVQLSPNYLSMLFKKDMGRNLIEYMTDYRIQKAKELLRSTSLKTYEIAENVGVPDSAYFSRLFKKATGVSPVEFRKTKVLGGKAGSHEDT